MKAYYIATAKDPFEYIPETYCIKLETKFKHDESFQKFKSICKQDEVWIYKPGEASNRGNGIEVLKGLNKILKHIESEIEKKK